jgi:hypothetical protein
MPKSEWVAKKDEMKQLKREIASLYPNTMFPSYSKERREEF